MSKRKKNFIALFYWITCTTICASETTRNQLPNNSLLGLYHPNVMPQQHERGTDLTESDLRKFKKALHLNNIEEYFNQLTTRKIEQLASSTFFIEGKRLNPAFGPPVLKISTFLYALTRGDKQGFYAAEKLLNNGSNPFAPYNNQTPLEIAQEKNAPKTLIAKLQAKELEQQQPQEQNETEDMTVV